MLSAPGARVARRVGVTFAPTQAVLEAQRALGVDITHGNAEGSGELPHAHRPRRRFHSHVRFVDVQVDHTSRTEVTEILAALDRL